MYWLRLARTRLRGLLRKDHVEREMDEELRFHLRMRTAENIRRGMSPSEAEQAAQKSFGSWARVKEACKDVKGGGMLETLIQDVIFGLRMLRKHPSFTLVAVLSLALGIGANTAIFSLVNAVLLKPPPFRDADRLVMVWEDVPSAGISEDQVQPATFVDWKAQNNVFEDMAALRWQVFNITGDGEPEKVQSYGVTRNFFPMLGAQPALGRNFLPEEDAPGGAKVVILSYGLWQRRYGGERNIIGREILLNGEKRTVVGVMPAEFQFLQSYTGLWTPAAFTPEELAVRSSNTLLVLAKLKPGVTHEQAQADMSAITERLTHEYPDDLAGLQANVRPIGEQLSGPVRRPLLLLLAAVAFVLLIACANVANLLLSRAASRRKEIALRAALGAGRLRIIRQLLTESVLLSLLGGMFGLLLAAWCFEFVKKLIPDGLVLSTGLRLSLPVLGYATLISLITGLAFGLAPALQVSRTDLNEALKQGGGRAGSNTGGRLRSMLVVTEVALSLVLLVGAGLLVQTVAHMRGQYANLKPEQLLVVRTVLPENKYRALAKRAQFYEEVLARVEHLPGVVSVGYTTSVPLQWQGGANGFMIEGTQPPPGVQMNAIHRQVSARYLQTLGISLREGRYLDEHDNAQSQLVLVVNETFARQFWQGESAIGRRISFGKGDGTDPWRTIVGVVADIRDMGMSAPVKAEMYLPYSQVDVFPFYKPRDLVVRATGDPLSLIAAMRREVHAVDPDEPLSNIATMSQQLSEETGARGTGMVLLASFAGLALLLAAVGIYGVLAYFVTQRVPEIGVRLALGAQPRDILALVLKKGMGLALGGVAIGLVASFALTRLMSSMLFGVGATDPLTFLGVSTLLAAVSLLACYVPAHRATKVDPLIALRYE
ncbi:MAG TPA: ABC transporter permease [Pyrinomonadaceae bacterium]|nr:ABC transporter permease [Pyrinomonadaceae bacterium]